MKRILSLFLSFWVSGLAVAQVTHFGSFGSGAQWMTFMGIAHDGDLLYLKSYSQPQPGVNSFTCVIGRYDVAANREIATVTLKNIEGSAAGFAPGRNGLLCDNEGNLYLSPDHSNKVFRFNGPLPLSGNVVLESPDIYTLPVTSSPKPIAFDATGNLYIGARDAAGLYGIHRISASRLSASGPAIQVFSTASVTINDIDFSSDGGLYVCGGGTAIYKYSEAGSVQDTIRFNGPDTHICSAEVAGDGSVYYVTGTNGAILRYRPSTDTSTSFAGLPGNPGNQSDSSTTDPYANARFAGIMNITLSDKGQMFGYDASNISIYRIRAANAYSTGAAPSFSLLQFEAFQYDGTIEAGWKVGVAAGVTGYTLETSLDSLAYTAAGYVPAVADQQGYSLKSSLEKLAAFVRLKISFADGSVRYSQAQSLRGNLITQQSLTALLHQDRLMVQSTQQRQCHIELYSMDGRLVYRETDRQISRGTTTLALPAGLAPAGQLLLVKIYDQLAQHAFRVSVN